MSNHCPIPIGWTVRVYRIPEKQGVAIHAQHESGREIEESMWIAELHDPQPLTVARLPDTAVDIDASRLAILWNIVLQRMSA